MGVWRPARVTHSATPYRGATIRLAGIPSGTFALHFISKQLNEYKIMATTNSAIVRCRINPEVKGQAEKVLASIGMSTSDAMRLFLKQVAIRGEFPSLTARRLSGNREPTAETRILAYFPD